MIDHIGPFMSLADLSAWEREHRQRRMLEWNGHYIWIDDGKNEDLRDFI